MVCVPTFDGSVKGKTAESLGNAIEYADSKCFGSLDQIIHRYPRGYSIARARNFMARWALEANCSHLLMVDSDMVLPENAIADLMSNETDVCLGYYVRGTSDDGRTNVAKLGSSNDDCYMASELAALSPSIVPVKSGGFGCALIRTSVFRRIPQPWFVYRDYVGGSGLSEDYDFCKKCHEAGISVYVDTRVACGHIHDRILEAM